MSNIGIFLKPQKGFCPNWGGERTIDVLARLMTRIDNSKTLVILELPAYYC